MSSTVRTAGRAVGLGLALGALSSPCGAQSLRGWVGTTVQAVELRPLALDTVPLASLVSDGVGGFTYQGAAVSCSSTSVCTVFGSKPKATTLAATQDVSFTAWGFGMEGLSFTGLLRGRARAGGDVAWPRSDDEFDAILAYAQLARGRLRAKLGRQEIRSGLGFPAFDGVSATWRLSRVDFEGYAGRSLARGLREPANEALRGLESFLVDKSAYLFGASTRVSFPSADVTGRYQREILSDRSGLVSERASFDMNATVPRGRLSGGLDYDFGFSQVGKGHLTYTMPLREGRWLVEVGGNRYVPYFDLSTIWGFFRPVAYHEVETGVAWSPSGTWGTRVSGGWRKYGETDATEVLRPITGDGWRTDANVRWQPAGPWSFDGTYRLEWGPGSFVQSLDAAARYAASDRLTVSGTLTTFQQIEEFRLGNGRAVGAGGSFDFGVTDRVDLAGGALVLRHRDGGTTRDTPWSQSRGWTALRVQLGNDPGVTSRRSR